ncbi:MAG: M56 family metallopeptidase [Lachnospiraceae bacterium]|nr:M56 family metallopeptidase [Lachnospiraceae bacterium]
MLENIFIEILNMSLTASVVILAVCVFRLFLKRAPKIFSYILWAVVLFRLLCPVSLESAFSLLGAVNGGVVAEQGRMEYIPSDIGVQAQPQVQLPAGAMSETVNEATGASLPVANVGDSVNPMQVVLFVGARIWLLGVFSMTAYQLISLLRFRKCLKGAPCEEGNIYQLPGGGTPFVYGLLRPRIYLPEGLGDEERRYMLLHEQIHIRRGDPIFRFLGCVALCLYWFNPLVWLAFFLSGRDMELSCDEAVLRKLGNGVKKEYSGSLLSLAAGDGRKERVRGIPVAFGEGNVKSRIKNVLGYRKAKPVAAAAAAVVCLIIIAALALNPDSDREEAGTAEDASGVGEAGITEAASDTGEAETSKTYYSTDTADAPEAVQQASRAWILQEMEAWQILQEGASERIMYGAYNYLDWRISSLELSCTYEDLDGADYQVWLMNYEFLVDDPDAVILVGGMAMDSEGWLTAGYPNSEYLIFEKQDDELVFVTAVMINDSTPGMEGFKEDIRVTLSNAAASLEEISDTYVLDDIIYDESHNIYSGIVRQTGVELRAMVTRQGNALTFSVITRSDEEDTFEGEINGEDSFYVENSDGGHLEGYAAEDEDGGIYLSVKGNAFGENVEFAFYLYTFYEIGGDAEDYYSGSNFIGVTASQAEYFAASVKAAVAAGDREAFAQMIHYPITLRLEEEVVVSDEEEMLLYYDDLMEYHNFAGNAANIFTKYMFANSMGVCVDDGIIWFAEDSEGECKIYSINPSSSENESGRSGDDAYTASDRILGYILYFEDGSAEVDTVEWITLTDTERMAELGITEEDMPGGFLIYNPDSSAESLTLSEECRALPLDWENSYYPMENEVSLGELSAILQERAQMMEVEGGVSADYSQCGLFWFEMVEGAVTYIEEQYVP